MPFSTIAMSGKKENTELTNIPIKIKNTSSFRGRQPMSILAKHFLAFWIIPFFKLPGFFFLGAFGYPLFGLWSGRSFWSCHLLTNGRRPLSSSGMSASSIPLPPLPNLPQRRATLNDAEDVPLEVPMDNMPKETEFKNNLENLKKNDKKNSKKVHWLH